MIWVISDIERVSGGRAHEDLLNESIKACQRGFCRDVALVVTKTDKLHLLEYLRYRARPMGGQGRDVLIFVGSVALCSRIV